MKLPTLARTIFSHVRGRLGVGRAGGNGARADERSVEANKEFWSEVHVTQHRRFADAQESLDYLAWRNDMYPGYIDLMPLVGRDGKVVLDFGCGPGNDLVGFAAYSNPSRLIGMDISPTSIAEARARLALHGPNGLNAEVLVHDGGPIPLEDASVDLVHCSGVLMHTADPLANLREFRRVLRPGGEARIMVYNRESIWLHLYVAYVLMLTTPEYAGLSLDASFKRSTDSATVPLNRCWSVKDFTALAKQAGFDCKSLGSAMSLHELSLLPRRFEAMQSQALPREHREFLRDLTIDERGWPRKAGVVAGIDGCFLLTPA